MIDQSLIIIFGLIILTLISVIVLFIVKSKKPLKYNIKNTITDNYLDNDNFDLAFNDGEYNISLEKMLPKVLDKKPKNNSIKEI